MEREERERDREREQEFWIHSNIFCVINVKYKEISWTVRRRRKGGKKVTSRSTESKLALKKMYLLAKVMGTIWWAFSVYRVCCKFEFSLYIQHINWPGLWNGVKGEGVTVPIDRNSMCKFISRHLRRWVGKVVSYFTRLILIISIKIYCHISKSTKENHSNIKI